MIVSSTAAVYYLTGLWVEPHERLLALYVTDDGSMTLFANEIFGIASAPELPVVTHRDGEEAVRDLAAAVKPGALGIDKFFYSKFLIALLEARPDVRPVQGSAPVDLTRRCKDEAEREAMRRASRVNDAVMEAAISRIHPGVRENELASMVNRDYLARGGDCEGTQLVCFGANGADPHHSGDATAIHTGDSVIFDLFTPIHRYWCDMTRTVFYRSVTQKQRDVYALVLEANQEAEARVRPGVLLSELDRTAREIITRGGYGPQFTHRLGHGCGLDCHEPPDVGGASDLPAEPGMIFSIEPGIYLPGEFGVRIEDLVLVTETGCEVLNAYSRELQVVG
jgi:Xaa-Pro dipeptidase